MPKTRGGFTMKSLKTICLYSFGCRTAKLRRIKGKTVNQHLIDFLRNGQNPKGEKLVLECLNKLTNGGEYLEIARILGNRKLTDAVVRTHWLAQLVSTKEKQLLQYFHNFSTLNHRDFPHPADFKNAPRGIRKKLIKEANRCLVRIGEVRKNKDPKLIVEAPKLIFNEKKDEFELRRNKAKIDKCKFLNKKEIKEGALVSFHFETARETVEKKTKNKVEKYTKKALDTLNKGEV